MEIEGERGRETEERESGGTNREGVGGGGERTKRREEDRGQMR